jgi:hypothetical protein
MPQQHNSKAMTKLLRELESKGFTVGSKSKRGTVKILPPKHISGPVYCTHATESAYHQIRRDVARIYNVQVG